MATLIRLNTVFNNNNLPVIPNILSGGLAASFKPNLSFGLVDQSGNNTQLTKIGDPELDSDGLLCGDADGYRTNLQLNGNLTIVGVFKNSSDVQWALCGDRDADGSTGWALYTQSGSLRFACYRDSGSNTQVEATSEHSTDGQFCAAVIRNDGIDLYQAEGGVLVKYSSAASFASRPVNSSHYVGIGSVSYSSWADTIATASEVTAYDKALTESEINKAYEYSKAYFNKYTDMSI